MVEFRKGISLYVPEIIFTFVAKEFHKLTLVYVSISFRYLPPLFILLISNCLVAVWIIM